MFVMIVRFTTNYSIVYSCILRLETIYSTGHWIQVADTDKHSSKITVVKNLESRPRFNLLEGSNKIPCDQDPRSHQDKLHRDSLSGLALEIRCINLIWESLLKGQDHHG